MYQFAGQLTTIETIETQIQTLQHYVASADAKFDKIMSYLHQGNGNVNSSQRTEQQTGTSSNPVTLDAGGDHVSSSGKVP